MQRLRRDLPEPEPRQYTARRAADQIGQGVPERQTVVRRVDRDRDRAQRQDHRDRRGKRRLVLQPDEPEEQRHEHHPAARTEKSIDEPCQRPGQQAKAELRLLRLRHKKPPLSRHSLPETGWFYTSGKNEQPSGNRTAVLQKPYFVVYFMPKAEVV